MKHILNLLEKRVNGVVITLIINGVILLLLGILIIWTDFMLRYVVGVMIFVVSYAFFFGAYRLWVIKDDVIKWIK
jgi:hypothetical protein